MLKTIRSLVSRRSVERNMRDEMQFHLDARIADLVARGMSPGDAARAARLEFGNAEGHRDDCRAALASGRGTNCAPTFGSPLAACASSPGTRPPLSPSWSTPPLRTYLFQYNLDAIPHLVSIASQVHTPESYTFSYANVSLLSPFSGQPFSAASMLVSIGTTGLAVSQGFQYGLGTGEMTQLTTVLGGTMQWQYRTYAYSGGRNYREVQTRYLTPQSGGPTWQWNLTLDNNPNLHASATVADVGTGTQKVWTFLSAAPFQGLANTYEERDNTGTALSRKEYFWAQDAIGNSFVSSQLTTLNPGTGYAVQSGTVQTPDPYGYGNIIQRQVFDYGNLVTPARTYNYTYLMDANYTSRYIRNRLLTATVTSSSGTLTLATNCYDNTPGCGSAVVTRLEKQLHDSSYGSSFNYRGNLTKSIALSGTNSFEYDIFGVLAKATDGSGKTVTITPDALTSSLPVVITPNGNADMANSVSYASSWAVASVSGPNGATGSTQYDTYGRPSVTTSPDGLATYYTYTYYPNTNTQTATVGGGVTPDCSPHHIICPPAPAGIRWTKTTLDGFGRTIRVETGHEGVTVNIVDTQYAPCACSPLGKVYRVSLPYAPGGTPVWTTYTYDALGRTLTVTAPDGASVTQTAYQGNQTTVTDPAGKWKTSTTDAMGNLVTVTEPNPDGGANLVTSYTYNANSQLTQVSMPRSNGTQTRTFVWSGTDLVSATNPENGTVTYTYDATHHVLTRTDAKAQQTRYTYDTYGRLTEVQHWAGNPLVLQANQTVTYTYDTPADPDLGGYTEGRLASVAFKSSLYGDEQFTYMYGYNVAGRVTGQRLQANIANTTKNIDAFYEWDNEGKLVSLVYPGKGSNGDNPPGYQFQYDEMRHLTGMVEWNCTYWNVDDCENATSQQVAGASYGAAGQVTSLTYDNYTETRTYNGMLQLTRMTVPGVMDMQYQYSATQNNGRITQATDGIISETVTYSYDALNRLSAASATNNAWGSTYSYDGFGNLTAKTPTAGQAPYFSASYDPATNRQVGQQYDANGNPMVNASFPYDVENRLTQAVTPFAQYSYDPSGKRVFAEAVRPAPSETAQAACEMYFYGITGERLATFSCRYHWWSRVLIPMFDYQVKSWNVYFAGKLMRSDGKTIVTDRLGSVRGNSVGERMRYYPYGEERTSTADGREKFGTYFRDGLGQDYADQRYYSSLSGRFWTVDPSGLAAVSPLNPGSWNRYDYGLGDPVNRFDPTGQNEAVPGMCDAQYEYGDCGGDALFWVGGGGSSGGGGGGFGNSYAYVQGLCGEAMSSTTCGMLQQYAAQLPELTPPMQLSGNILCEQEAVRSTIEGDAQNLGLTVLGSGYTFNHVTVAGLTDGGTASMTEVYYDITDPDAWGILVSQLTAAGFVEAGYDPLHGEYDQSFRQMTDNGTWSMQVSYSAAHNLQIDIDPNNPMQNLFGHAMDVVFNTMTGRDTNYHSAASNLGIGVNPCK